MSLLTKSITSITNERYRPESLSCRFQRSKIIHQFAMERKLDPRQAINDSAYRSLYFNGFLDHFKSQDASVRANAFLNLACQGAGILNELKDALKSYELPSPKSYSPVKFQYLSWLFDRLPIDQEKKLSILVEEFRPKGIEPFLWGSYGSRIDREISFLAVAQWEEKGTRELFENVMTNMDFGYDMHCAVIQAIICANCDETPGVLLKILAHSNIGQAPSHWLPLFDYAFTQMFNQNLTSDRKKELGIPQMYDFTPEEFLAQPRPEPGEEFLDLRTSDRLTVFEENSIHYCQRPQPQLVPGVVGKMTDFVARYGIGSENLSSCLSLINILNRSRWLFPVVISAGLQTIADNSHLHEAVRSEAGNVYQLNSDTKCPPPFNRIN